MTETQTPRKTAAPADDRLLTRTAVLDAAERLFAEKGVEGVSIRDITAAAGANLAAVNYHFGSKERLVMEVFARRLEPMNRARLARLDALETAAGPRPVELSRIIEAFVRCSLVTETGEADQRESIMRLLSRCFFEPDLGIKRFLEEQLHEVASRFDRAISRAVPGLAAGELFWRMSFFIGALHHAQEAWTRFEQTPRPGQLPGLTRPDLEDFIARITSFVTAGMREPSRGGGGGGRKVKGRARSESKS